MTSVGPPIHKEIVLLTLQQEGFTLPLRIVEQLDLGSSPYTRDFCARVENRRQGFPGQKLFIDRLFSIGNINSSESSTIVNVWCSSMLLHLCFSRPSWCLMT